jgi:hypothetical protein
MHYDYVTPLGKRLRTGVPEGGAYHRGGDVYYARSYTLQSHSIFVGREDGQNKDAASALSLSLMQVKRLKKRVKMRDASGVVHRNKGRLPFSFLFS